MKANEAPEKLYILFNHPYTVDYTKLNKRRCDEEVEYTRTDAFIEKACGFLKSYRQDTYDGKGYIAGIVNDETIEEFRKYMGGE